MIGRVKSGATFCLGVDAVIAATPCDGVLSACRRDCVSFGRANKGAPASTTELVLHRSGSFPSAVSASFDGRFFARPTLASYALPTPRSPAHVSVAGRFGGPTSTGLLEARYTSLDR
ncbi:hypothetical protein C8J57DRAFT_1303438 [Mycena rebaudengoi]|nr:hypothetical protein C8J57DRAFT_1303438 [Mycena rebaudengoi]